MQNTEKTKEQLLNDLEALQARVLNLEKDYREAKNASENADRKYRDLFENASDSILIIDPTTYRIIDANVNAARRLGYSLDELLALTLDQIEVIPDETGSDQELFWESAFSGARFYECHYRRNDGSLVPVEVSSSFTVVNKEKVIQNFVRDVTKRKEIEADRRRAEAEVMRLATVIEQATETVIITDLHGNITYANPYFERTTGYKVDEVIGQNPRFLQSGLQDQAFYKNLWETITSGNSWHGTFTNRCKEGDFYYEEATIFPIRNLEGQITHYAAVKRDITERILAEQEREQLIVELNAFAHTVAHDLKSPLSVLYGYATFLDDALEDYSQQEVHSMVKTIRHSSQKMSKIIDELLLFASTRQLNEVRTVPLGMEAVIDEALARLEMLIQERHAEITVVDAQSWPLASGYVPWVEEVWANYISNAIKYGGTPPCIEIGATLEPDEMVRFWVRDNGAGIPSEKHAQLFKTYSRLGETHIQGHGLGLSIVQRIVKKLGGEVGIESTPGQGSTFSFTLPIFRD